MGHRTPLFDAHVAAGAKVVDFGGWDMPLHYGSQIEEHHAVRKAAGVFDVSHMTVVDVAGAGSRDFLRHVLANDVAKLKAEGRALYTAMLNEAGGVIDDLIVYLMSDGYRLVVNCSTREKDLAWLNRHAAAFDVTVNERPELAILAVQGPAALERVAALLPDAAEMLAGLRPFRGGWFDDWFIARTGYTGEQGVEMIIPGEAAADFWARLLAADVAPVGLGARDTLRLEAGMNLYGNDMDETTTPAESNMGWTVALDPADREFIGRAPVAAAMADPATAELIGLVLPTRGVLRAHYEVACDGEPVGEITSGAFAPTLQCSVALARVARRDGALTVDIRGKAVPVTAATPNFVRNGAAVWKPLDESA